MLVRSAKLSVPSVTKAWQDDPILREIRVDSSDVDIHIRVLPGHFIHTGLRANCSDYDNLAGAPLLHNGNGCAKGRRGSDAGVKDISNITVLASGQLVIVLD